MILKLITEYSGLVLIDKNGSYLFKDIFLKVQEFKNIIEQRLKQHDKVVIYSDYSFNSIALLICLSEFPVNIIPIVKTTIDEYNEKIESVNPNFILSFDSKGSLIIDENKAVIKIDESFKIVTNKEQTGIVLFSSGTTGKPKVMIQNLTELIYGVKVPRKQKSLKFILLLMFDHIGGLNTLLNCLISGAPFVIPESRSPERIISLIEKHEVNILPTTPTFLNLMLMSENFNREKLKSLKLITYGTERMSALLLEKLNNFLPNIKMLQTFGTSETGILKTISKSSTSLFFKIIDDEKEFKIIDGELYLKSKTSVSGYLNHSNKNFKENGWYATGDLVEVDKDNYIKIIGRKNKVINVGGLKVLPKEIEDVINSIDGVDESTVFGEENNLVGNIVCARVYTNINDKKKLKSLIKLECRNRLDKFKVPVKLYFEKLKMNVRGKKK